MIYRYMLININKLTNENREIGIEGYISLIKLYRHFYIHIFCQPFELPYRSDDIRRESVNKPSIIRYLPST